MRRSGKISSLFRQATSSCAPLKQSWQLGHLRSSRDTTKKKDVREANIEAAKAVADAVRTSLGPRGMDKMVGAAGWARNALLP